MKGFTKLLILGGLLAASAAPALADSIAVTVSSPSDTFTSTSITFANPGTVSTGSYQIGASSGSLAGTTFTFINPQTFLTNASETYASPVEVAYDGPYQFYATDVTSIYTPGAISTLTLTGDGYFLVGTEHISSVYYLNSTSVGGPATFTASSVSVASTPEPSSLVLLGTGLLGAAGVAFRKRLSV